MSYVERTSLKVHRMHKRSDCVSWKDALLDQFVNHTNLPGETLPGIPLVELTGERRVLIENHKGVVAYGCKEICVKVQYGILSIRGSELMLSRMTKEQLIIVGRIDCISVFRGRAK